VISSAKLKAIPVVKFTLTLIEAVLSTANYDAVWLEEFIPTMEGNPDPDILFKNKFLYYSGRLWILDHLQLRDEILEPELHSKVAGHMCRSFPLACV
jgi:hypothetical protein